MGDRLFTFLWPRWRWYLAPALLVLATLAWGPALAAPPPAEQARIDRLIDAIAAQESMRFMRNGSEYTAANAGTFLRRKMKSMGAEVRTCEEFIEQIASKSSTSGEAYKVKTGDGKVMPSGDYLRQELGRIERQAP